MTKHKLNRIVLRNTLTNYLMVGSRMLTAIFITRMLVLNLGDSFYGFWGLLWTVFGWSLLLDFGFGTSMQKFTAQVDISHDFEKYNRHVSAVMGSYFIMSLIIAAGACAGMLLLNRIFLFKSGDDIQYYKLCFIIFGLGMSLAFPFGVFAEILKGLKRYDLCNYVYLANIFINMAGIFIIFRAGWSLMGLTVFTVVLHFSTNISMMLLTHKLIPELKISMKHFNLRNLREIANFSTYAYIIMIANQVIYSTDEIVLGVMLGLAPVAIYRIGTRIPEIMMTLTTQFQNTLAPVAASLHEAGDKDRMDIFLFKSNKLTAFMSTGVFIVLFMLSQAILLVWLKEKDAYCTAIAQIMLVCAFIQILFKSVSNKFLLMAGKHKALAAVTVTESILNIVLSVILVLQIGVIGVALGTLIPVFILSVFVVFPMTVKKFSALTTARWMLQLYMPLVLISIPTLVILKVAVNYIPPEKWNLPLLAVFGCGSGLIYLLLGYIFYINREEKEAMFELLPPKIRTLIFRKKTENVSANKGADVKISDLEIKRMSKDELGTAIDWAANEGWNPGINDIESFFAADPEGFFMARSKEGEALGCISAVKYGSNYGFIGFFIVRPQYRGHIIGKILGEKAMRYLGTERNIGLDGVEAKIKNYSAFGFILAHNNVRYEGSTFKTQTGANIVSAEELPFEKVMEYDRRFFPAPRPEFMSNWISRHEGAALCAMTGENISGLGVIRKCRKGYKIGPLFADDSRTAETLMLELLNRVPEKQDFYLDIPETNPEAVKLVNKYNMKAVFKTARMYSKPVKKPPEGLFGITSFELG